MVTIVSSTTSVEEYMSNIYQFPVQSLGVEMIAQRPCPSAAQSRLFLWLHTSALGIADEEKSSR